MFNATEFDIDSVLLQVASYVDPEIHQHLSEEDKQAAKRILPNLMKNETALTINSTPQTSTVVKATATLTDKLKILVGMSVSAESSKLLTIDDELTLFTQAIQSYKGEFASFWIQYRERFSRLYNVARRINIVSATSVPSESIFSIAGYVARKQRVSLSSTSLRYSMVLKESHRLDAL